MAPWTVALMEKLRADKMVLWMAAEMVHWWAALMVLLWADWLGSFE